MSHHPDRLLNRPTAQPPKSLPKLRINNSSLRVNGGDRSPTGAVTSPKNALPVASRCRCSWCSRRCNQSQQAKCATQPVVCGHYCGRNQLCWCRSCCCPGETRVDRTSKGNTCVSNMAPSREDAAQLPFSQWASLPGTNSQSATSHPSSASALHHRTGPIAHPAGAVGKSSVRVLAMRVAPHSLLVRVTLYVSMPPLTYTNAV
jgi:hypothetical protein